MSTYFFTSNYQERYKSDAALALAYPRGHIITFRYNKKYVAPQIQQWTRAGGAERAIPRRHRDAFVVFADYIARENEFQFYPLRKAKIVRLWTRGEAYLAALQLQDYVCYANDNQPARFREWILQQQNRPVPKELVTAQRPDGNFMLDCDDRSIDPTAAPVNSESADFAWQNIVESIAKSPNLKHVVYWRVDGIYLLKGYQAFTPKLFQTEKLINPTVSHAESRYRLSMGKNYVMKFVTYVPGSSRPSCVIEFNSAGKDGAMITPERLTVSSRYNEDRILIGCKRALDSAFNPLEIKNKKRYEAVDTCSVTKELYNLQVVDDHLVVSKQAPKENSAEKNLTEENDQKQWHIIEAYLRIQIDVPRRVIFLILLALAFASLLLSVGPDMVRDFSPSTWSLPPRQHVPDHIAVLSKALGAVIGFIAGYIGFRKLPIGK